MSNEREADAAASFVERLLDTQKVGGSSPSRPTTPESLPVASELDRPQAVESLVGVPAASRHAGDPFGPTHIRRFFEQVQELPDGCWMWTGAVSRVSYGAFSAASQTFPAHRYSYELFVGEVPAGLEIDHLCRMRECVNPLHVEPVTHAENMRRASLAYKADPGRYLHSLRIEATCKRGHEKVGRKCARCMNDRQYTRYWSRRLSIVHVTFSKYTPLATKESA